MAAATFKQKLLNVKITLASGNFGGGGGNTLNLSGLRVTCQTKETSADSQSKLEMLAIYGMTMEQMNQASVLGKAFNSMADKNRVVVTGGDAGGQMATVFDGPIHDAAIDATNMPQTRFLITGSPGGVAARKPVAPTSFKGPQKASTMFQQLAQTMGLKFENNAVDAILHNPYLHGTAISQCRQLADSVGCGWIIDKNKTLAVWPKGQGRGSSGIVMSAATGMIGYPSFSSNHMTVRCNWDPNILPQKTITLQSEITPANGEWSIIEIETNLESMVPHGKWEQVLSCAQLGSSGNAPDAQSGGG